MDQFFKLVDGPIIEIDVFGLIFDGSHEVHETLGIESSFKDLVSEKNLFIVLGYLLGLHDGNDGFWDKIWKKYVKVAIVNWRKIDKNRLICQIPMSINDESNELVVYLWNFLVNIWMNVRMIFW